MGLTEIATLGISADTLMRLCLIYHFNAHSFRGRADPGSNNIKMVPGGQMDKEAEHAALFSLGSKVWECKV